MYEVAQTGLNISDGQLKLVRKNEVKNIHIQVLMIEKL